MTSNFDYGRPENWDDPLVMPNIPDLLERILVAVDGSYQSERAISQAAFLAKLTQAEVIVVVAYNPITKLHRRGLLPSEEIIESMRLDAHELANEATALLTTKNIKVRAIAARGDPAEAIVTLAEEEKVSLIIMGHRGLGNLKRFLLGSVTERVLQTSSIPVLIQP
ncbi:universal stress protein [uncultured Thiothrix sp.]|uniref:universal stress protein n=1 Tax=uncultured Thiothrix sp. TaxID=223185 RepID=UPI0026169DE0|nr:universal stress protein [uncultured Thiothrix sp.]